MITINSIITSLTPYHGWLSSITIKNWRNQSSHRNSLMVPSSHPFIWTVESKSHFYSTSQFLYCHHGSLLSRLCEENDSLWTNGYSKIIYIPWYIVMMSYTSWHQALSVISVGERNEVNNWNQCEYNHN